MVLEGVFMNVSEIISALPPQVTNNISTLINILKAVGILFIIYFIYLIINGVVNWRGSRRIKLIEKKVKSIERKIDLLLKGKKKVKKK